VPFPGDSDRNINRLKECNFYRPVRELDPDLPPELDAILAKLLTRDPRRRFSNATELIDVLNASGLARHNTTRAEDFGEPEQALAPTRVDIQAGEAPDTPISSGPQWHLRFRDADDIVRHHRGTTAEVVRWFTEGLLPENIVAARNEQTRFRPLVAYREFQALRSTNRSRVKPQSLNRARRRRALSSGEWLTVLNLSVMCLTGLLSIVLSVTLFVWMLQQG
jgi:hypothetical protein